MTRPPSRPAQTARAEERQAGRQLHAIVRAKQAKAAPVARRRAEIIAEIIAEEIARPRARDCTCPITPRSTIGELRALGAGCTAGRWVCPTLDAIRRRLRI